jgi:hypothetical protein
MLFTFLTGRYERRVQRMDVPTGVLGRRHAKLRIELVPSGITTWPEPERRDAALGHLCLWLVPEASRAEHGY